MSWNISRSSMSPSHDHRSGPVWSSTVNVVNPVLMVGGWPQSQHMWHVSPEPLPLPVQTLMSGRPVSVMTGSFIDDFSSVPSFVTATPSSFRDSSSRCSTFRDVESSKASTIRDFESSVTYRNENEYENDFYDDLTELRTDFDVPEIMFESSSSCSSTECDDSSEGYPSYPLFEVNIKCSMFLYN